MLRIKNGWMLLMILEITTVWLTWQLSLWDSSNDSEIHSPTEGNCSAIWNCKSQADFHQCTWCKTWNVIRWPKLVVDILQSVTDSPLLSSLAFLGFPLTPKLEASFLPALSEIRWKSEKCSMVGVNAIYKYL